MSDVQLGTLSTSDLSKSANLDSSSMLHTFMRGKAQAKARHPATPSGRRQQFSDSAKAHLNASANNAGEAMTIRAQPSSSMPSRSSNFADNASMN
jgi:hypothetical protein